MESVPRDSLEFTLRSVVKALEDMAYAGLRSDGG
jgi:hypothetical protein